jgi:hypothetical protein
MLLKGKVKESKSGLGIPALVFKSDETGKNLGSGTSADIDGNYSLNNINKGEYITASMLGLKPQTKIVSDSPLNFELSESAASLLNTFEVIADRLPTKPSIIAQPEKKQNWFKRNQKLVVIGSVSLIALIMGIIIVKATKN